MSSRDLFAEFLLRQAAADLKAILQIRQGFGNLPGKFVVRQSGTGSLKGILQVGQDSRNLFARFVIQHTGTPRSVFVKMRVMVHFSGKPQDLVSAFVLTRPAQTLKGVFVVRQAQSRGLPAEFTIAHSGTQALYAKFDARWFFVEGWADEKAVFITRQESSVDAPAASFIVRQIGSTALFNSFVVRHTASVTLKGLISVRHSASITRPKGIFIVRHPDAVDLKAVLSVRHSGSLTGPKGIFIVQHWLGLKGLVTIRHSTYSSLDAKFYTRFPMRFWTNRRYLNGVVDLSELDMRDAILEYVIEGVMEDLQGELTANSIDYSTWTDITLVPILIRRAVTYGVVASLYARKAKTFRSRVIPSVQPVTVTVMGDERLAMEHWENRRDNALNKYLTSTDVDRVLVSTADQEPVFSSDLEDIPRQVTSETSWHEWQQKVQ